MSRRIQVCIVATVALVGAVHAQDTAAGQGSAQQNRTVHWVTEARAASLEAWHSARQHASRTVSELKAEAATTPTGLRLLVAAPDPTPSWSPLVPDSHLSERVVVLVHGLDEPGPIWDDLAPALAAAGYTVVRFDYPNDQSIAASADLLAAALRGLRARGVISTDLVCHSMGGLVARDVLTRPTLYACQANGHEALPDMPRVIMLATPHTGAPLARFEAVAEGREQLMRWADSSDHDWRRLLAFVNDGGGEAADDLLPGSTFLKELNARPTPRGVALTCIAAELMPEVDAAKLEPAVGEEAAVGIARRLESVAALAGDGAVPLASATAFGAGEVVVLNATHRGLLRVSETERRLRQATGAEPRTPPAIPIILDRLARPALAVPSPAPNPE